MAGEVQRHEQPAERRHPRPDAIQDRTDFAMLLLVVFLQIVMWPLQIMTH